MKKMSEVFELPINHEFLEVYGPERACVPYAEAEKHAANAINHVDSLADALAAILDSYESQQLCDSVLDAAQAALASYRGEL